MLSISLKENIIFFYLFVIIGLFMTVSCVCRDENFKLQEGDLLFQDADCGLTCDAIEQVTSGYMGANLSHMGMAVKVDDSLMVLEAISKGVILTPLNEFLQRSVDKNNNPKVLVGRLKNEYQRILPKVLKDYSAYLGKPYNSAFLPESDGYYCSEMIYKLFKNANNGNPVFHLAPMTFKVPGSEETFPVWKEYFEKLNISVPEGVLGCNPGSVSQSEFIDIVYAYGVPDGYNK